MKNLILTAAALLGLAAGTLAQSLPNYVPADGLVGWWPFNGNANDESGNGNNGTVNGAALTTDRLGNADKAYIFDGIDDFISTQYLGISGSFARSFNGWFKTVFNSSSNDQPGKTILIYGSGTGSVVGDRFEIELGHSCNGLGLDISGFYYVKSNSDINYSDNNWHMFTVVMNPNSQLSNIDFFLDGVLLNSYSCGTSVQLNTSIQTGLNIGRNYLSNGGRYFPGSIDDIAIYNRALTQEEITALYTGEPINPPTACNPLPTNLQNGLVGYWPFCGNANDESGNGNDGGLYGVINVPDRNGNPSSAYKFDGNSFISINHQSDLNLNGDFSITSWINADALYTTPGYVRTILSKHITGDDANGYIFNVGGYIDGNVASPDTGVINFQASPNYNASTNPPFNVAALSTNIWYNVSIVYNHNISLLRYFINSQLVSSVNIQFDLTPNTYSLIIGAETYNGFTGGNHFFSGVIDDIGIWNRALTQEEITALYTATNCASDLNISPSNNAVQTGSTATFTATTTDPNPSYVWQSDFGQGYVTLNNYGNYSGVNSNSLSIANLQLSAHNLPIRAISTSGECIDTSNVSIISIADTCINSITDTSFIAVTDTLIINTLITDINPPNNSNTIKVFPNPTGSFITIDYGNFALMSGYQLRIENSLGQQVFQTNITQQTDSLSLSTWGGNGLYFVHIVDPQGNTIDIRKVVLQ